jgi:hypothetical protein
MVIVNIIFIQKSATSTDYPRISFAQSVIGLNTCLKFIWIWELVGNSSGSGVFTPSKGTVFINGTAPFVYDGQILSSAPEWKIITPADFL